MLTKEQILFAWQGWSLELPPEWNPQRLEGDFANGYALIADLHGPKLGIRWTTPVKRKFDAATWVRRTLLTEIGQLAADEAIDHRVEGYHGSTIYLEPEPPGRDVWLAISEKSGRTIELVYHAPKRDRRLADKLLPTLTEASKDRPLDWSVFDLHCQSPAGWSLSSKLLNAGDLSLEFARGRERCLIRQIGMADLALRRMPLDKWLAAHLQRHRKNYQWAADFESFDIGGRGLSGVIATLNRKRTLFWKLSVTKELCVGAFSDARQNKLLIVEAPTLELLQMLAGSALRQPL